MRVHNWKFTPTTCVAVTGATVGQMEDEAILYMRQRGLKEEQARRLQIEGFAADVVGRCRIEAVKEILTDAVVRHLDKI